MLDLPLSFDEQRLSSSPTSESSSHKSLDLRVPVSTGQSVQNLQPWAWFESVSDMVSSKMLLLSASCWLLVVVTSCEESIEERSPEDDATKTQEEKELIEALQEVLEKLKSKQLPSLEKKLGWLPSVRIPIKHPITS
ncbi:hypothetical protein Q8A73_009331 [Channa argus]|nr:hypothetical protein Q8A73_009331 [Channa argus]